MNSPKQGPTILNVVFIILILLVVAAVLRPVLAPPRRPSPGGSSQSCLQESAIALETYWNDYDGKLPSSALVSHAKRWNKRDFLTFATTIGHLQQTQPHPRTWAEVLYSHMKSKDVMFCPWDNVDRTDPNAQVSYWWKTAIDKAWFGEGCKEACQRASDFPFAADTIVFYEHTGWHSGDVDRLKNGTQINVVYLDSHVWPITLENFTSGDPVNCAANSDGEPMYFNYDESDPAKTLPSNVPARYIDPARYADKLDPHILLGPAR